MGCGDDGDGGGSSGTGGSGTGGSGTGGSGATGGSGTGGSGTGGSNGGTWSCTETATSCTCTTVPGGGGAKTCSANLPCCFTFKSGQFDQCQCHNFTGTSCDTAAKAVSGTKTTKCPP